MKMNDDIMRQIKAIAKPYESLSDNENFDGSGAAERERLKGADIVFGLDTSRDVLVPLFGIAALKRIVRNGPAGLKTVAYKYDQRSNSLEWLIAAVQTLKGACCYEAFVDEGPYIKDGHSRRSGSTH